jgi:hypothetical protein
MVAACFVTILAYGVPTGEAVSLAFLGVNRYAYILGAVFGTFVAVGAHYLPKRAKLVVGAATMLTLASVAIGSFLGFATLY